MNDFRLLIISAEETVFDNLVSKASIIIDEKEIVVSKESDSLIETLEKGEIIAYKNNDIIAKYTVEEGVLQVNEEKVTLLAISVQKK